MHWTTESDLPGTPLSAWCLIYRVGAQPGWLLYVPDMPNNRERPQAREPYKFLNGQSYGARLAKETFWSPATRDLKKESRRAITPAAEAVCVPAHLVPPGSLQAKQLCHLHAQLSLGQNCHRQKKSLGSMHTGSLRSCPTLCNPVDCGLPGFCVNGVLQARILEHTGQYWLPNPSKALYFMLP